MMPLHDWRTNALGWAIGFLMAPIAAVALILYHVRVLAKTRPLVRGRVQDAWERCSAVWREQGLVCQWAAHDGAGFGHELAVALARYHRTERAYFLGKIADPDPLMAAYAFKCLIRTGRLRREELPVGALQRSEPVKVLWADLVDEVPLGDYLEGWFREQEWLGQQPNAESRSGV